LSDWLIDWLIDWFIHSLIHWLNYWLIHGYTKLSWLDQSYSTFFLCKEMMQSYVLSCLSLVEGIKVFKNLKKPGQLAFVAGLDKVRAHSHDELYLMPMISHLNRHDDIFIA